MSADDHASGEDRLIARYFKPIATHPGALGLVDDTAVLSPAAGQDLVLKADAIVGSIHFFPDDPPEAIARKALRVNLSDLAAKGAKPVGFLLSLGIPTGTSEAWLEAFARGLGEDAEAFGCPLLGGDTIRAPDAVMVSITVLGTVPAGTMVRRAGARAGDLVFVTGTIGDAALGLQQRADPQAAGSWGLSATMRDHLVVRYLVPQPRNALAEAIRSHASGSIDVSDGLIGDLGKLCRASGVSAAVEATRVPLSEAARTALAADPALLAVIFTGGDDFEVIATVPPDRAAFFADAAEACGVAVTEIGRLEVGQGVRVLDRDGQPLEFAQSSFSHF